MSCFFARVFGGDSLQDDFCVCLTQGGKSRDKVVKILVSVTPDEVLEKLKKEASTWPKTSGKWNTVMHLGEQTDGFLLCTLVLLGIWILTGKRYPPLPPSSFVNVTAVKPNCSCRFDRKSCVYWGSVSASVSKTCPLPCSLRVSECSKIWFIKQKAWSDGLQRRQYNVKCKTISLGGTDPRSVLFTIWWRVQFHTMSYTYI